MTEHRPPRPPVRPLRPEFSGARDAVRKGLANVQDQVMDLRGLAQQKLVSARGIRDLEVLLQRASHSRVGASREFEQFRVCVEDEIARDGGAHLLDELYTRHDEELRRLRNVIQFGRRLAERFRPKDIQKRFMFEVVRPAHRGQIDGQTAWDRTDALAGVRVRDEGAKYAPGWTIGLGGTGEAGAGAGVGLALGLCGIRHGPVMVYVEGSIAAGAKLEVEASCHIQFAHCMPSEFLGFSVSGGVGAAYVVAGSVDVAFAPKFHRPSLKEPWVLDYAFDSITIQVGAGLGVDVSISLAACAVAPIRAVLFPGYRETR